VAGPGQPRPERPRPWPRHAASCAPDLHCHRVQISHAPGSPPPSAVLILSPPRRQGHRHQRADVRRALPPAPTPSRRRPRPGQPRRPGAASRSAWARCRSDLVSVASWMKSWYASATPLRPRLHHLDPRRLQVLDDRALMAGVIHDDRQRIMPRHPVNQPRGHPTPSPPGSPPPPRAAGPSARHPARPNRRMGTGHGRTPPPAQTRGTGWDSGSARPAPRGLRDHHPVVRHVLRHPLIQVSPAETHSASAHPSAF